MKATKLIDLLARELAKAASKGYGDVEVQLAHGMLAYEVGGVGFTRDCPDEDGDGERAAVIYLSEGELDLGRYNYLPEEVGR